jgi:CHAT domain-containing protein
MFAGAKRIMPTLWDISAERPTDELLTTFFNKVLHQENPISPTAALQHTQIELWKKYRDPYYWAAFTIQGEWQE